MTYTLCMQGGPLDGTVVAWDNVPPTFKFPTFGDAEQRYMVQYNLFPMVPCYVYARDPRNRLCRCTDGLNHFAYTYVGRDTGTSIVT